MIQPIKGLIFDYGATIDSNGMHWAEVIWNGYNLTQLPITKEQFRESYVHAERTLARNLLIYPKDSFKKVLKTKIQIQLDFIQKNYLNQNSIDSDTEAIITNYCYGYAQKCIQKAIPVLSLLSTKYSMVLVSNFYGNISTILKEFHLDSFFKAVIESAVVGIRKPDPQIFQLGIDQLNLSPQEIVVIGDSYRKDILPAHSLGCQTIWLKGLGWDASDSNQEDHFFITDFRQLLDIL